MAKNEITGEEAGNPSPPCNWRFSEGPYTAIYGHMATAVPERTGFAVLKISRLPDDDD